jgi:peptidyl-prolyl cis-trans isomerase D
MLDVLRASKGGLISWLFLAALILVFAFVGPGSSAWSSRGNGNSCAGGVVYAAQVNGDSISLREFEDQHQQVTRMLAAQYGDDLARQVSPQLAMNQVVARALVLQEAARRGLQISDEALAKAIAQDPTFQEDGHFSQALYDGVANDKYHSKTALDEAYRRDLLYNLTLSTVEATAKVPESEVKDSWRKTSDKVAMTMVFFPKAAARAEAKPTDAEVSAIAAKEAARVEKYYADNAARYDQQKQVRVRHLLFKSDGKGGSDAAKKKAEAALARLKKGDDFAKVAAEVSEDANTKQNGGDLGLIHEGLVEDAVGKAALALEKGQLSEPVQSPTGWHVLRVDEVIPAKKTPLAEVKLDIARTLVTDDRTDALLKERSQAALTAARAGQSLTALFPAPEKPKGEKDAKPPENKNVVKLGGEEIVAQEFGPVPVSTQITQLGDELMKDAAAAKTGDVLPKAYPVPSGVVVAVVKERARPDEAAFAKEREGVLGSLRRAKADQVKQAWIQGLRAEAKVVENQELLAGEPSRPAPE